MRVKDTSGENEIKTSDIYHFINKFKIDTNDEDEYLELLEEKTDYSMTLNLLRKLIVI